MDDGGARAEGVPDSELIAEFMRVLRAEEAQVVSIAAEVAAVPLDAGDGVWQPLRRKAYDVRRRVDQAWVPRLRVLEQRRFELGGGPCGSKSEIGTPTANFIECEAACPRCFDAAAQAQELLSAGVASRSNRAGTAPKGSAYGGLTKDQYDLLKALADSTARLSKRKLGALVSRSSSSVEKDIRALREWPGSLVTQGNQKGYAATEAGIDFLKRHPPPSARSG